MSFIEKLTHVEHRLRPLFARMMAASVFTKLYSATRAQYLSALAHSDIPAVLIPKAAQRTCFSNKLVFRNDLGNAAGFDKDGSLLEFNYRMGAGFALVGTVLSSSYQGNVFSAFGRNVNPWVPLPFSSSAINSLGLPSKGVAEAVKNIAAFKERVQPENFPIGISIMGHPAETEEANKLEGVLFCVSQALPVVDFIEINESCPNTEHNRSEESLRLRLEKVIALRDSMGRHVPVLVKLADLGEVEQTLRLLAELNVDGVVLVNTQKNYTDLADTIHEKDRALYEYYTKKFAGGVSGLAIKDYTNQQVCAALEVIERCELALTLIQVGGIHTAEDIAASRTLGTQGRGDILVLREWYTGFMAALGQQSWDQIYRGML